MGKKWHATKKRGNPHRNGKNRKKRSNNTIGCIRGLAHEEQAFMALDGKFKNKPRWYAGWSKADGSEDHKHGTDLFIHTFLCSVRVDIKSSSEFAEKVQKRTSRVDFFEVIPVVVKSHMTEGDIRYLIFSKVEKCLLFNFGSSSIDKLKTAHHHR